MKTLTLLLALASLATTAQASELDQAEAQLAKALDGQATVSRKDIPQFTDEDLANIQKAMEELREVE